MKTGQAHRQTSKLATVRSGFARWRTRRKPGEHIPDELWRAAVDLAGELGINKTARALRLDYYSLKKHVDDASTRPATAAAVRKASEPSAFVEIPPGAIAPPSECVVELEHPGGAKMRVTFKGAFAAELAALIGTFARS